MADDSGIDLDLDMAQALFNAEHALKFAAFETQGFAQLTAPIRTGTYQGAIVAREALDEPGAWDIGTENVNYALPLNRRTGHLDNALEQGVQFLDHALKEAFADD